MPKDSRGGQGGDKHLGNDRAGSGYGGSVGNFPEKKNPFQPFKTYQKEFANANDLPTLKKVLEDNGVVMSDKLEKYIANETLSEAMKNVITRGPRTSTLSKDICTLIADVILYHWNRLKLVMQSKITMREQIIGLNILVNCQNIMLLRIKPKALDGVKENHHQIIFPEK